MDENESAKTSSRNKINLAAIGHVNSGKSTLLGHFVYKLNLIDQRTFEKLEAMSAEFGKPSFKYSWIFDKLKAERERGLSIKNSRRHFVIDHVDVTITNPPGHLDYVKNLIKAIAHVDYVILVVSAQVSEYEISMDSESGSTMLHAKLAYYLGCSKLIVCITKMDTCDYSNQRYDEIVQPLSVKLKKIGWKANQICYIPVSGWNGDNLVERNEYSMSWYYGWSMGNRRGKTLFDAIKSLNEEDEDDVVSHRTNRTLKQIVDMSLRMPIQGASKIGGIGTVASGRIEYGVLKVGMNINFSPSNITSRVERIEKYGESVTAAYAGDTVGFNIKNVSRNDLHASYIATDAENCPMRQVESFQAQIVVLDHPSGIRVGYCPLLFCHILYTPCKITRILEKIDRRTKESYDFNSKNLYANEMAIVKLVPSRPICLEKYSDYPRLGRFIMLDLKRIVIAGIVKDIEYK